MVTKWICAYTGTWIKKVKKEQTMYYTVINFIVIVLFDL